MTRKFKRLHRAGLQRLADMRPPNELLDKLEESIYRALSKEKYSRQENMKQLLSEIEEIERAWFMQY